MLNILESGDFKMTNKERFIEIYNTYIKREGADRLLDYLEKSDFFVAPASARFHCSTEGGLCEHSLNVYDALRGYLNSPRAKETYGFNYSEESIAIVALLHDLCKIGVYKKGFRNVKDEAALGKRLIHLSTTISFLTVTVKRVFIL